jgi:hypothetical protein
MGLKSKNDYDRQAAEDHKSLDCVCLAWLIKSQAFLFGWLFNLPELRSTSADPLRNGSAKQGDKPCYVI